MKKIALFLTIVGFLFANQKSQSQTVVEIGTGTSTQRYPLGSYFGYERSAALYTSTEIATIGNITKIAWYANSSNTTTVPIKIYLKETTSTTLTASNWSTMTTGATMVFDGSFTITGNTWNEFTLTTNFNYSGTSNLLVLVETNYGGTGSGSSTGGAIRYTSETSKHQYWQADTNPPTSTGTVSNNRPNIKLFFAPAFAIDLSVTTLNSPNNSGCYGYNQSIAFTIKNVGSSDLDFTVNHVTLGGSVTGPNALSFSPVIISTGTLVSGGEMLATLSTNYNMDAAGTYTFKVWASIVGDPNQVNDTLSNISRTVTASTPLPNSVNFTGFSGANLSTLFPGWYEAQGAVPTGTASFWTMANGLGGTGNITAKVNLSQASKREWIIGPKITATTSSIVEFDVAVLDNNSLVNPDVMGSDDAVYLMISTDCGNTWNKIDSFTVADNLPPVLTHQEYSLAAYDGRQVRIAFFATEGTVDDIENYDFHLDNINIRNLYPIDISLTELISPAAISCYGANHPVKVRITNAGINNFDFSANNVTVEGSVSGVNPTTFTPITITSGILNAGNSIDTTIAFYNMSTTGTYTFKTWVNCAADPNKLNDTLANVVRTNAPIATIPIEVNFNGFNGTNLSTISPGWYEATGSSAPTGTTSAWLNATGVGDASNVTAKVNMFANNKREWIVGPKFIPQSNTALDIDVAVTDKNSTTIADNMGSDDAVYIMYSLNCGATWNKLDSFTVLRNLPPTLTKFSFNLGMFAGQELIIAVLASDGTIDDVEDYDFHIDNIKIWTMYPIDIAMQSLIEPAAPGCYSLSQPIVVQVKNIGSNTLDFSTNPLSVAGNVSGAVTTTLGPVIVNTGTLNSMQTMDVTLMPNFNMSNSGTYTFSFWSTISGDGNLLNDTIKNIIRTVSASASIPQNVNFNGFTGANLNTLFVGWNEAAGTTPIGTASAWTNASNLGTTGNVTAKINLFSNTNREWIISPKITATSNTAFELDVAVTDKGSVTLGDVMGSDDAVYIMISTNCGATWQKIDSFTVASNLPPTLTRKSYYLGAYNQQQLTIGIYATDGIIDNIEDYDFHIDNLRIWDLPAIDISTESLIEPVSPGCYSGNSNVKISIKNYGNTAINLASTPITIGGVVTGVNPATFGPIVLNSGSIQVLGEYQATLSNNYVMTNPGTYTFTCWSKISGDANAANDTIKNQIRTVPTSTNLPISINFSGFTGANLSTAFPGWWEGTGATTPSGTTSAWVSHTGLGSIGNVSAKVNLLGNTKKEWIVGPKLIATEYTAIEFDVAVLDNGSSTIGDVMGSDDAVYLMVLPGCSNTWQKIDSFTVADNLPPTLTHFTYNLNQFDGQQITIALFATEGIVDDIENYDFHVDNLNIWNMFPYDLGVTDLLLPASTGCYSANQTIRMRLKNYGSNNLDFSVDPIIIGGSVSGANNTTIGPVTLTNGIINGGGGTLDVDLTNNYNMTAVGNHIFKVWVNANGDYNAANDTLAGISRTVIGTASFPQQVNFTGFTGANLSTLFPGWYEATGNLSPTGTSSAWTYANGVGGAGNITAKVNMHSNTKREWIVGPKIDVNPGTNLEFDVAVTNTNSLTTPDIMGSDDRFYIMISSNCGVSWHKFDSITAAHNLPPTLTNYSFNLSSYVGNQIIIGFLASEGTIDNAEDYDFHLDNIVIRYTPGDDAAISAIIAPADTIGENDYFPIKVVLKNLGTTTLTSLNIETKHDNGSPIVTPWTGNLPPLQSEIVTLPGYTGMLGSHSICAKTILATDVFGNNDQKCKNYWGVPSFDAGITHILTPNSGCNLVDQQVKVRIKNFGGDSIVNNLMVCYQVIPGGNIVMENFVGIIPQTQTYDYTFNTLASFPTPLGDSTYRIKAYTKLSGDVFAVNDTAIKTIRSYYSPSVPTTVNDTVNYGQSATLKAFSTDTVHWYTTPVGGTNIASGNIYHTPLLFQTTTYWVESKYITAPPTIIGLETTTQSNAPFNGGNDYGWSGAIYLTNEVGAKRRIDTIGWQMGNNPDNYQMIRQKIYLGHFIDNNFFTNDRPDTNYLSLVYDGPINWNGNGWVKIPLTYPFNYDGLSHLIVYYENFDGSLQVGQPTFMSTTVTGNKVVYKNQNTTFPYTSTGTLSNIRPNIYLSTGGTNCSSNRVPVKGVVQNIPSIETAITEIKINNGSGIYSTNDTVKIKIKNNGIAPVTNLNVRYFVNQGPTISETVTTTINPGSEIWYSFNTHSDFSQHGAAYNLTAYHTLPGDGYRLNDTLKILFYNEIFNIPYFNNFDNDQIGWSTSTNTPTTNWQCGKPNYGVTNSTYSGLNAWDINLTTPYDPNVLCYLYTPRLDFTNVTGATLSFWHNYKTESAQDGVFVEYQLFGETDWLPLGVLNDPNGTNWYNTTLAGIARPAWSGLSSGWKNAKLSLNALNNIGIIRMRFVFRSNGSNQMDGYSMDNFLISFPIDADAGVTDVTLPTGTINEESMVGITATIKNFGQTTITSMNLITTHNGQNPITYPWTGSLLPNATTTVNLPGYPAYQGLNEICVATSLTGDINTFNDQSCKTYTGFPKFNAGATQIIVKTSGCDLKNEPVKVAIKNYGWSSINSSNNLTASYLITPGNVLVTENVPNTIAPNATITYTFSTLADFPAPLQDSNYLVTAWTTIPGDIVTSNDTTTKAVRSSYTPAPPTPRNATINYGYSAFLRVITSDYAEWYNTPTGGTPFHTGYTYTTPILYDTARYYVLAKTVDNSSFQIGNGTSTTNYIPMYGYYDYSWSATIYTQSEMGNTAKQIDTIAYEVGNTVSGYVTNNQKIYMGHISDSVFSSAAYINPVSAGMTLVYDGNVTWNGPGWYKFKLITPFNYSGSGNLLIVYENRDGSYASGYPNFKCHTTPNNKAKYKYADSSFPTTDGTLTTNRPNIKLLGPAGGCASDRTEVTAFVVNIPDHDVGLIDYQITKVNGLNTDKDSVKVRLKNFALQPFSNIPLRYKIDNGPVIYDTCYATINPGETKWFTFKQTSNFEEGGYYQVKIWSALATDPYQLNDTLKRKYGNEVYKVPYFNNFETDALFWKDSLFSPTTAHTKWLLGKPNHLFLSLTYSGTKAWDLNLDSTYFSNAQAYLYTPKYNFKGITNGKVGFWHNFQTESPNDGTRLEYSTNGTTWNVLGAVNSPGSVNWYNTASISSSTKAGWSGDTYGYQWSEFTLGPTNVIQFRFVFTSNNSINKDGHSIDNFTILIPPPYDPGIIAINQPTGASILEDTPFNTQVVMKNFGHKVLDTVNIVAVLNERDTIRYKWTGSLGSFQTTTINIPGFITPRGNNNLCVYTVHPQDTVPANDRTCKEFFGIPRQQVAISNLNTLTEGCGLGYQPLSITVKNVGVDTIKCFSPIDSSFTGITVNVKEMYGVDVITDTIFQTLAPNQSIVHNFSRPFNFYTANADSIFRMFIYASLYRDLIWSDDTIYKEVKSFYTPMTPLVNNPVVNYGDSVELGAFSNGPIYWYADSTTTNHFYIGNLLSIPFVSDTITYYVQARNIHSGRPPIGTGTSTQKQPFGVYSGYERSAALYLGAEVGASGNISRLAWYPTVANNIKIPTKIYLKEVVNNTLSASTWANMINGATLVFEDTIILNVANEWYDIHLQTPFNYNNNKNLLVLVETNYGATGTGVTTGNSIRYSSAGSMHQIWQANNTPPTTNGTVNANRPNIYIQGAGISGEICENPRIPITASVINIPYYDIGLKEVKVLMKNGLYTDSTQVMVYVKNFLPSTVFDIPVTVAVNGVVQFTDTIPNLTLIGKDSVWVTLPTTIDLSNCSNTYTIDAYTEMANDPILVNNHAYTTVHSSYECIPYFNDFESQIRNWRDSTNNVATKWQLGKPNYGATNSTFSGNNAWDINLTSAYGANAQAYLFAPRFDLTNLPSEPRLGIWHNYKTQANADGVWVEYSTNGTTWQTLGIRNDPNGTNWYNTTISGINKPAWSGNSNGWVYSEYKMGALSSNNNVMFRFVFRSDASTQADGYSIDDISVFYMIPKDAGVISIQYPNQNDTLWENDTTYVRLTIKNFGLDSIFPRDSMKIMYAIQGIPKDTMLFQDTLAPTATKVLTFPKILSPGGTNRYCATTILDGDINYYNNSNCRSVYSYPRKDIGVFKILSPVTQVSGGMSGQVKVTIKNYSPVDTLRYTSLYYRINNLPANTHYWNGTLLPGQITNVTFPTPYQIPTGQFRICVSTTYQGDGNPNNDSLVEYRTGVPVFKVPYTDNFEGTSYWAKGPTSSWQLGIPGASVINRPHSPMKVWATNLTGNYNNNARDTLYSPRFNMKNAKDPKLKFWHWIQAENNKDGGVIQVSVNGGPWGSWGYVGDPAATNWYNGFTTRDCWTGLETNWKQSTYVLPTFWTTSNTIVQFRFIFIADNTNNYNGWAIDDFQITVEPINKDAGVVSIAAPQGAVHGGDSCQMKLVIRNYGLDTLYSIPIQYKINNGYAQNATINEIIAPNQSKLVDVPGKFVAPNVNFRIIAYTKVPGDVYNHNDTAKTSLYILPPRYDVGVVGIVTPNDTTYYNNAVNVEINVKNYGTDTVFYIPVHFQLGNGFPRTETIVDTIAPGSVYTYRFNTTYVSDTGIYQLCAFTNLPNDVVYTNDKFCKYIIGVVGINEYTGEPFFLWQNIPNPAIDKTTILFSLPRPGNMDLIIRNMMGHEVYKISKKMPAGQSFLDVDLSHLPNGVYLYSLIYNGKMMTKKMIISR